MALDGRFEGRFLGDVRVAILGEAQPPLCAPLPPWNAAARAARPLVRTNTTPCSNFFPSILTFLFGLLCVRVPEVVCWLQIVYVHAVICRLGFATQPGHRPQMRVLALVEKVSISISLHNACHNLR